VGCDETHSTGWLSSYVAKPTAQNGDELESKFLSQLPDFALALVDEIAAGFSMLAADEGVAHGEDAPADTIAGINDSYVRAVQHQVASSRQSGQPGSGNQHANAAERAGGHTCSTW
jgi:hypothetical protein